MSKWILCKDELPPINIDVLIFTGESQFPYEVMKYYGKRTRIYSDMMNNEREEEYDYWLDNNGGVCDSNPVAWQFIDSFIKEGELWVEGRVV